MNGEPHVRRDSLLDVRSATAPNVANPRLGALSLQLLGLQISLESVPDVIRMRDVIFVSAQDNVVAMSAKHTGMVFHIFFATTVLVMDLRLNEAAAREDGVAQEAEVVSAYRLLGESKSLSAMASEVLESLKDVLRKQKIRRYHQNSHRGKIAGVAVAQDKVGHEIPFHFLQPQPQSQPQHQLETDVRVAYGVGTTNGMKHSEPQFRYATTRVAANLASHQGTQRSEFDSVPREYVELAANMDTPG